ncbi:putative DNA-binding pseudobarrel domain superfamily [Helianthus annuus]|nr:putative DNA-binding pseudobarrel domain superfamily [Helianthus annuus]
MEDTLVLIKHANFIPEDSLTRRRNQRILTTENNKYLRKIEELANKWLRFFRDKELQEEKNKSIVKEGKRPQSTTSVVKNVSKKRKVPKKGERPPVVTNEITQRLDEFIVSKMNGTDVKLVIQKTLYKSDTLKTQNRLNMPFNQLQTNKFLTEDERQIVEPDVPKENNIEVSLLGPTLEMYKLKMELTMWPMLSTYNYVLKTNWYQFWFDNRKHLKEGSKIQVWSFRRDQQLCFAIVCVEATWFNFFLNGQKSETATSKKVARKQLKLKTNDIIR